MSQVESRKKKTLSREQQAHAEVGVTKIRPGAAALFVSLFLGMLCTVFIIDHFVEWKRLSEDASLSSLASLNTVYKLPELIEDLQEQKFQASAWLAANRKLLASIQLTEEDIEEQGAVASWLRPWSQNALLLLGVGNEQVYPGKESWLFYRPDIDFLTGAGFLNPLQLQKRINQTAEWEKPPQPDPLPALIDFHRQLAERGIRLLLVPVPVKPEIMPEQFTSRMDAVQVVTNPSFRLFVDRLTEAGIEVADVTSWLNEYKEKNGKSPFLRTDTHWTPSAMQWVAGMVAEKVNERVQLASNGGGGLETESKTVTNQGDIAAMLDLHSPYPSETVSILQVISTDASLWRSSESAEVLVLGDSFSNIYSLEAMGWGESSGFAEHISYSLSQPVDRIVRNDQGAFATRQVLARELARGRDRLAGKKMVVYQFAGRELMFGDWSILPLELKEAAPSNFLSLAPGEQRVVSGVVGEVSAVPRPGSVPYRDHVVSIHLVDIGEKGSLESFSQAVVFLQSMTDNVWSKAARLRPGDQIDLELSSWNDMAREKDGLNRSELDSLDLQLQEPVWGKILKE